MFGCRPYVRMIVTLQFAQDFPARHGGGNIRTPITNHVTFRLNRNSKRGKPRPQSIDQSITTGLFGPWTRGLGGPRDMPEGFVDVGVCSRDALRFVPQMRNQQGM